jgi:hypothetical protein
MRKTNGRRRTRRGFGLQRRAALALLVGALAAAPVAAQDDAPTRVWGQLGMGARFIDEEGPSHLFQERNDLHEGWVRGLELHAVGGSGWGLDLDAPRFDATAHDVTLSVRHRLAQGRLRTSSNRFHYDAVDLAIAERQQLAGNLSVRPNAHVELFGDVTRQGRSGERVAVLPGDEGELGPTFDQATLGWRGGARLFGWRSSLQVAFLQRALDSDVVPDFDRTTRGGEVLLRSRPVPRLETAMRYGHGRTELDARDGWIESDRFDGSLDVRLASGWSAGPRLRFEQTTDTELGFTAQIWGVGLGAGRYTPRWGLHADAEVGQRQDTRGDADVWGAGATGRLQLVPGVRLELSGRRRDRTRQDEDVLPVGGRALAPGGTLWSQRLETRLRLQRSPRWNAALRLARLDKEYGDIDTRIETWRYGVDAGCTPHAKLRLEAGWHLDDVDDAGTAGAYALRTQAVNAGFKLDPLPRLRLRARVDVLDVQRDLDLRKAAVSTGFDLDVYRGVALVVDYENDLYDEERAGLEAYRANVLSVVLRRGFER